MAQTRRGDLHGCHHYGLLVFIYQEVIWRRWEVERVCWGRRSEDMGGWVVGWVCGGVGEQECVGILKTKE